MYDEIGAHFSRTRQKSYGESGLNWPVTARYLKKLQPGESVLDLGCGNGKLVSSLPTGANYLGVDFSKTLLDEAKQLFPTHEFVYGDLTKPVMWKPLQTYDAIFCVATLHHIPEKKQQLMILTQMKKHLKKGGFLYLTVWNLWQEKFAQFHLASAKLKETDPRWVEIPYNRDWKRFCVAFDIQSLTDLYVESGLDIQELFYADQEGKKSDIMHGQNLVVVAK